MTEHTDLAAILALLTAQQEQITRLTEQNSKLLEQTTPGAVPADKRITVADLIAKAEALTASSSLRTYRCGWTTLIDGFPEQGVPSLGATYADQVTPSDLKAFIAPIKARALQANQDRDTARFEAGRKQRNDDGAVAVYNAVGAWRRLFRIALDDGCVLTNPADSIRKPTRRTAARGAFDPERVPDVLDLARCGGDDPDLDEMIVLFHLITGARREGALNLELRHLDREACNIVLDEKFGKIERQPVPDWFIHVLRDFAIRRGAVRPGDAVFRKRKANGTFVPMTGRRYDSLFQRMQSLSPWADSIQLTSHVLRHCAGTYVDRVAGKAVALLFLRHSKSDVTDIYTRATKAEVAAAVIKIWGGSHPLAPQE